MCKRGASAQQAQYTFGIQIHNTCAGFGFVDTAIKDGGHGHSFVPSSSSPYLHDKHLEQQCVA
jgi:hypothetical protein